MENPCLNLQFSILFKGPQQKYDSNTDDDPQSPQEVMITLAITNKDGGSVDRPPRDRKNDGGKQRKKTALLQHVGDMLQRWCLVEDPLENVISSIYWFGIIWVKHLFESGGSSSWYC